MILSFNSDYTEGRKSYLIEKDLLKVNSNKGCDLKVSRLNIISNYEALGAMYML